MKSKRFNILKFVRYFSFIIFIFITFGTSIFTYTSLTTGPIEFIGMFILLFGTECFKTYSIVEFYKFNFFCKRMIQYADEKDKKLLDKILLKTYRYKQYKRRAISFLLSYILCAVVSIIGNLGFTIVNVESKNSVVNTTYSSNTTILSSKIEQLNNKMKDKEKFEQEKEYYFKLDPTKYLGTIRRYEGFISEANKEIKILNADIEKLQNTKVEITSTVKRTVYQIMSDAIRIPEKVLSFIFLLLLGLIPEIGIIKTAPHPTYERKDRKYKKVRVEKEVVEKQEEEEIEEKPVIEKTKEKKESIQEKDTNIEGEIINGVTKPTISLFSKKIKKLNIEDKFKNHAQIVKDV